MRPAPVLSPDWFVAPKDAHSIVLSAPAPRLVKVAPSRPLASQAPTVVAKNYPRTMAKFTSQKPAPALREKRPSYSYPLMWQPTFRWKDVLPWVVMLAFMGGVILEVERLEHQQMARFGECSTAVARTP